MNILNRSTNKRGARCRAAGFSAVASVWLLCCVSAGLWFLLGPAPEDSGLSPLKRESPSATSAVSAVAPLTPTYRNIEDVRVGQRVVTPGTQGGVTHPTEVDAATWKQLTLRLLNRWPDGTVDEMRVQTLQPPLWIAKQAAHVGSKVGIPLDLAEMGIPQQPAEVMAIDRCPPIEEGPGRVVLTTVSHLNNFLFDLKTQGERGPPSSVTVTGWHKLYSESRGWTSVCELMVGERLTGRHGPLAVTSLHRHPGTSRVYNMTVEGEHVYYVTGAGLLAHNQNCGTTYQTYTKVNPETGEVYSGRTSGTGTPEENVLARDLLTVAQ